MIQAGNPYARRLGTVCLILSLLIATYPQAAVADPVKVGDVEIDPRDFSPQKDPQTRIAPCLACHGANAGGDADFGPDVQFGTPALRGLTHAYLEESLRDYRDGRRPHEEMRAIALMLDEDTIGFMARSFAAYLAPTLKSADELTKLAAEDPSFRNGQAIAEEGVAEKDVPACMSCHGEMGEGDPELGPHLAGQNSLYIRQQFTAYANNIRKSVQAEIMQPIAAALSEEEVEAVSRYYQQLARKDKP